MPDVIIREILLLIGNLSTTQVKTTTEKVLNPSSDNSIGGIQPIVINATEIPKTISFRVTSKIAIPTQAIPARGRFTPKIPRILPRNISTLINPFSQFCKNINGSSYFMGICNKTIPYLNVKNHRSDGEIEKMKATPYKGNIKIGIRTRMSLIDYVNKVMNAGRYFGDIEIKVDNNTENIEKEEVRAKRNQTMEYTSTKEWNVGKKEGGPSDAVYTKKNSTNIIGGHGTFSIMSNNINDGANVIIKGVKDRAAPEYKTIDKNNRVYNSTNPVDNAEIALDGNGMITAKTISKRKYGINGDHMNNRNLLNIYANNINKSSINKAEAVRGIKRTKAITRRV